MRIRDIIDIVNSNKEKLERAKELFESVPFIDVGEPDTKTEEYKKYCQFMSNYRKWLETDLKI